MIERLESVFSYLTNKNVTIAIVVLCILAVRQLLKRYPRKYCYFLWAALGAHIIWVMPGKLVRFNLFPKFILPDSMWNRAAQSEIGSRASAAVSGMSAGGIRVPADGQTVLQTAGGHQGPELLRIAAVIWGTGVVLFGCYLLVSYLRMRRRVRFGTRLRENIFECDRVSSPFVMGVFLPRIYLPVRMDREQQEYVICHEQYHIRRKDHLVKLCAFLLLGLYWFHPMMWAAYFCMCRDMEMSCDEHVVETLGAGSKQAYSTALLDFASGKRLPGNLLGFGEHEAHGRIKNILRFRVPGRWVRMALSAVCAAVFVMLGCSEIAVGKDADRGAEAQDLVSEEAKGLYEAGTPYIGDASAVGKLLNLLAEYGIMPDGERTMELFTEEEPYGMAVHFAGKPEDEDAFVEEMYHAGALCWALIGNLEDFRWTFPNEEKEQEIFVTYYLDEEALKAAFPEIEDIKSYGDSAEGVQELMEMLEGGERPDAISRLQF